METYNLCGFDNYGLNVKKERIILGELVSDSPDNPNTFSYIIIIKLSAYPCMLKYKFKVKHHQVKQSFWSLMVEKKKHCSKIRTG